MFAETARRDLERLRSAGYRPTDADVVRLNDLAVQLEHGRDTTAVNHPRIAFAGNVVLHEPTLGALEWWFTHGEDAAWTTAGKLRVHWFMLAHARRLEILATLEERRDIMRAVRSWIRGCGATEGELLRAMMYVRYGTEWAEVAGGAPSTPDENADSVYALIMTAAGATGMSPDVIRTETETGVLAMVAAARHAGEGVRPSVAKIYMAYQQTVREIEARGKVVADGR